MNYFGFNLEVTARMQKLKVREFSGKVYFIMIIKELGEFPESLLFVRSLYNF
jgi:hypothetical protein